MISSIKFKDHDEWLSIRNKYIGGSDAGAVVEMNPYRSRYALWAEKTGKVPPFEGNITTKVGAFLEQLVADMFEEETGKKVRKRNATLVNDRYPFACANVDRLVCGENALLEIKTTNSIPLMRKLRGSDEFPEAYYCQVVHYMAVTGLKKAYLAVLINCRDFKIFTLERDEDEINALMQAEAEFWKLVKNDTPPAPDGEMSTSDTISTIYADSNGEEIDLFGFGNMLSQRMALNEQIKALKQSVEEIDNSIKDYMKEAEKGSCDNYTVSWKTQTRKTFDTKAFSTAYPQIDLTHFSKETKSRVFKITENKGE